jgi:hypothetical protein
MLRPSEGRADALASPSHDPRDETIGGLVHRLMEDGRAYARAELNLVKRIARHRAGKAKSGAMLLGIGITLLLCSLTALILALVLGLATLIGPFGAGMAVVPGPGARRRALGAFGCQGPGGARRRRG